jgi:MIT (microtubule interacting and transport) domain
MHDNSHFTMELLPPITAPYRSRPRTQSPSASRRPSLPTTSQSLLPASRQGSGYDASSAPFSAAPHGPLPDRQDEKKAFASAPATHKRRSSIAHVASDSVGSIKEGIGALSVWTSQVSSQPAGPGKLQKKGGEHRRASSFSRRLSIGTTSASSLHGPNASLQPGANSPKQSPARSPRRQKPSTSTSTASVTALPPLDTGVPPQPPFDFGTASATASATSTAFNVTTPLTQTSSDYFGPRASSVQPSPKRKQASSKGAYSPRKIATAVDSVENLHRRHNSQTLASPPSATPPNQGKRQSRYPIDTKDSSAISVGKSEKARESDRRKDEEELETKRQRERRDKDKKTMLSRALQKAHRAVILDNEQNFEGAIEAYGDACNLLQEVLTRSAGEDDRRKLDAIVCDSNTSRSSQANFN